MLLIWQQLKYFFLLIKKFIINNTLRKVIHSGKLTLNVDLLIWNRIMLSESWHPKRFVAGWAEKSLPPLNRSGLILLHLYINILHSNHNVINPKLRNPYGTHAPIHWVLTFDEFRAHISEVHLNMIRNVTLWHSQITTIIRNHFIKQFVRPLMRTYCVETQLIFCS